MLPLASLATVLALTAPWPNGGTIAARYTCDGANARPKIGWWAAYPPNRKPPKRWYAVEMVDLDAPGGIFVHWLQVGRVRGRNTFGKLGYSGPCPPHGDKAHRYVIRVYELSRRPALTTGFTAAQLRASIRGHIVATGAVVGRYGR